MGGYSLSSTDYTFVTGLYSNNKIDSLGVESSATEFKIQYDRTVKRMSTPTVGVVMADTWIARWDATYSREEQIVPSSSTIELGDSSITTYENKDQMLDIFSNSFKNTVKSGLEDHAEELRTSAIEKIINQTPESTFEVSAAQYTLKEAWKDETLVKTQIRLLVYNLIHSDSDCKEAVKAWWTNKNGFLIARLPANNSTNMDLIYEAMLSGEINEVLKTKVNAKLETYVAEENKRREKQATKDTENLKKEFEEQLNAEGNITWSQTVSGEMKLVNISESSSSTRTSSKYVKAETTSRSKDGEKFSEIFNKDEFYETKQAIIQRTEWFWEYIRENEDTEKLEDVLRYLLNLATNSNKFGSFSPEEIEDIFKKFEPEELISTSSMGSISAFGVILTREEFIAAAQAYNGGDSYYILSDLADDFYDICTQEDYNVNPCLAYAWACLESEFGGSAPYNNLFGMGIGNGESSGKRYSTYQDSIKDFCRWVTTSAGSTYTIERAEEFAQVNSKFLGGPENSIYALFSTYMYLGDTHICDEPDFNNPAGTQYYIDNKSNSGSGGRYYIYYMYELGGICEDEYATRCGHPNGTDETTLQEKADYVQYSVNERITIAKSIFGNGIFVGADGSYEEINDQDRWGIYTSTFGRRYTEWKQSSDTSYGMLPMYTEGKTMASYGCNVHAATMLLNAEGIDISPEDAYYVYKSGENSAITNDILLSHKGEGVSTEGTINVILEAYGINGKSTSIWSRKDFISALLNGHGVMTWVSPGSGYTSEYHWIVVADIRETQLGDKYGYDVYVLSSTHRSDAQYGWVSMEVVADNLQSDSYYGLYISN